MFKQKALVYLADATSEPLEEAKAYILATIILLMLLELYEGGIGSWSVHLEGAKQLLDTETADNIIHSSRMIRNILEELVILADLTYSNLRSYNTVLRLCRSVHD
ncbi:hypothetical protein NW752_007452 [Fusarium irregulare]|nr:hypothetical protein NW752_007452 [Fusarium irregulare]